MLQTLEVFLRTAELQSFTKAAESLGLSRATVSRMVSGLESRVGRQLLVRTTRRVALTDAGRDFYEKARRLSSEAEELLTPELSEAPLSGTLRIASSPGFAEYFLGQVVEAFAVENPGLSIDLRLESAPVDLVATSTDLAFAVVAIPEDGDAVIGSCRSFLCASSEYVELNGMPESPDNLTDHQLVTQHYPQEWVLAGTNGETRRVKAAGRLKFSAVSLAYAAVKRGCGIGLLPDIVAGPGLASGELVKVLDDWNAPVSRIVVRRSPGRITNRAAEAFVGFITARLRPQSD